MRDYDIQAHDGPRGPRPQLTDSVYESAYGWPLPALTATGHPCGLYLDELQGIPDGIQYDESGYSRKYDYHKGMKIGDNRSILTINKYEHPIELDIASIADLRMPLRPMYAGMTFNILVTALPIYTVIRIAIIFFKQSRSRIWRRHGKCSNCGYLCKGLPTNICPECGAET